MTPKVMYKITPGMNKRKLKSWFPLLKLVSACVLAGVAVWQLFLPGARHIRDHEDLRTSLRHEGQKSTFHLGSRSLSGSSCVSDACVEVDLSNVVRGSDTMYGIAWEDINHAGEGGLHVEMVRDWSFEARAYLQAHPELVSERAKDLQRKPWPKDAPPLVRVASGLQAESMDPSGVASLPLADQSAWQVSGSGNKEEMVLVSDDSQLNALCVTSSSVTVTWLTNKGHTLRGFAVEADKSYRLRLKIQAPQALSIQAGLGTEDGETMYADSTMHMAEGSEDDQDRDWRILDTYLIPTRAHRQAFLHLTWRGPCMVCVDWVSLTPRTSWSAAGVGTTLDPFHPRLMAALTALQPQFLRFPGGAIVEGITLATAYRWKDTVGPRERRPGHPNANWGYWSSDGLGLYEYMQLADRLAAEPVYVMSAGISHTESAPPGELQEWIQDGLDALQFILGDSQTTFGGLRARMGRAKPWALTHVVIGNEECRRPWYAQHYVRFAQALHDAHPSLKIISNCDLGTAIAGAPAPWAWEFHSYKSPTNTFALRKAVHEYKGPQQVAVTEFAALGPDPVQNAVAEAGLMTALERNCTKAQMIAYAPVFGHDQLLTWMTTLLTFNDSRHWTPSPSFTVQQLFREHWRGSCAAVQVVTSDPELPEAGVEASASCTGVSCVAVSIKLVNFGPQESKVQLVVRSPQQHIFLMGRKKSSMPSSVEAKLLQLNTENLMPRRRNPVLDSEEDAVASLLAEDEEGADGNALGRGSGLGSAIKSKVQLNLNGKPVSLSLPPYSITVISAKLTT